MQHNSTCGRGCSSPFAGFEAGGRVSELCIVGKATIFIPSPNVAEDHQTKNAMAVSDKGAAILLKEDRLQVQIRDIHAKRKGFS